LALPKINAASDLIAAASALTEAAAASKGKSSAEGGLERRANTPSGDPTRDLAAAAMAIGSNPLSSTRKWARTALGSRCPQSLDYLVR
jgi:hypothetical protein